MANLSSLEKREFEDLFQMGSGYVMGDMFTNASFADLFQTVVHVTILDPGFKPTLVNTSAEYCALPFTGPLWNPASIFPLRNGNIQVRP